MLPDIDIPISWLSQALFGIDIAHRLYTHTLIIPLVIGFLGFMFYKSQKYSILLWIVGFGWAKLLASECFLRIANLTEIVSSKIFNNILSSLVF